MMAAARQPASEGDDIAAAARFRRARPDDAVEVALETFRTGARVDMQTLAIQLDVSPATLHRWFGSRAQLLDKVCERLAVEFGSDARASARGDGDARVCDYLRRITTVAAGFEPARAFVRREPQLAIRLLLGSGGGVHRVVAAQLRELIAQTRSPAQARRVEQRVDLIVQVTTSLVWATFMIGEEPQIDDAVEIVGMILASGRAR